MAKGALSAFAYSGGAARDPAPVAAGPAAASTSIKVKEGGLADVLVYVKSGIGAPYSAPVEPVLLDQVGCEYCPSMIVVMVGQPLRIRI